MSETVSVTPLMIQYQGIKDQHRDAVLFFRLGDFYEMFNEDAIEVSRLLNLTLTRRGESPMCGVPYHASKVYIARLLRLGKKIAICEQTSQPTPGKGLTERKVVEIITPGTTVEEDYLERGQYNFLAALCPGPGKTMALAVIDISTASFSATSWKIADAAQQLPKEIGRFSPRELLLAQSLQDDSLVKQVLSSYPSMVISAYPDWHFALELSYKRLLHQFKTVNLRSFSLTENAPEVAPAGFLLDYVSKNTSSALPHVQNLQIYRDSQYMSIDDATRKNLELVCNLRDGSSHYSLLEVVNHTVSPMGNRLLRSWLLSPLTNLQHVKNRQSSVSLFVQNRTLLTDIRRHLSSILDVERLASRIAMDKAHGKDLQALRASLVAFLQAEGRLNPHKKTDVVEPDADAGLEYSGLFGFDTEFAVSIIDLIEKSIIEEPSIIFTEGKLIKKGWSGHLDHLHQVQDNFSEILDQYLEEEKQKSGISNLKIRYNRMIGYYIEVTKGNLDDVPEHFIRRRSLANAERFSTDRLEELERELLGASEKIIEEERRLFFEVRDKLKDFVGYLLQVSEQIAYVDTIASFAHAAILYKWVCPLVDESQVFEVTGGRHPVVEMHLPAGEFVPNDISLDTNRFALITGPNMAGKSTFLRQNALIAILAQIGSFVPAEKARLGLIDTVFCRVGASDNLARGESTFLVEMSETAHILRSATKASLVIMDEVGRGTSTEDGLSIAWAISEYLLNTICSKTLFATHYHELTRICHPALQLLCLDVLEREGQIVFLKRIKPGASGNSYGLHVAQLAGIPAVVVKRAAQIVESLQAHSLHTDFEHFDAVNAPQSTSKTPGLFSEEELIVNDILSTNIDTLTPLAALQKIAAWKKDLMG